MQVLSGYEKRLLLFLAIQYQGERFMKILVGFKGKNVGKDLLEQAV